MQPSELISTVGGKDWNFDHAQPRLVAANRLLRGIAPLQVPKYGLKQEKRLFRKASSPLNESSKLAVLKRSESPLLNFKEPCDTLTTSAI